MKIDDESLQRQLRRAIADEVDSVRLKSVQITDPDSSVKVIPMRGVGLLVGVLLAAVVLGAAVREVRDSRQLVAAPSVSETFASTPSPSAPSSLVSPSASPSLDPSTASPGPVAPTSSIEPASPTPVACGEVENGEISVCPGSGPIGTRIRVEGRDCSGPGAKYRVVWIFVGEDEFVSGGTDLPSAMPDSSGRVSVEFTIPAVLSDYHGHGGGPTRPGTYRIISKPAYCIAHFIVTPS